MVVSCTIQQQQKSVQHCIVTGCSPQDSQQTVAVSTSTCKGMSQQLTTWAILTRRECVRANRASCCVVSILTASIYVLQLTSCHWEFVEVLCLENGPDRRQLAFSRAFPLLWKATCIVTLYYVRNPTPTMLIQWNCQTSYGRCVRGVIKVRF